ncbi:DinB family protein [Membranihabitans marinus]|uniref:DinB family protein n=1 Tax=Membranihabitans marinus TaxID=1227546 RepID=UPI001F395772|nr:DinB family protein [Membranihabitans marinus]
MVYLDFEPNNTVMKNLLLFAFLLISSGIMGQGLVQKESAAFIKYTSDKIMQLLDEVSDDELAWRPEEDVRSFGEVFAHVISANYFFASKLGAEIPESVDMKSIEMDYDTKSELKKGLESSYALVLHTIGDISDDGLTEMVEFPMPGDYTQLSTILIIMSHSNEHLGQLIAYARINGIVPPWSMEE